MSETSTPRHIATSPAGLEERLALATGGYSGQEAKAAALARGATVDPSPLDGRGRSTDWSGRAFLQRCARSPVNETKEAIVAVMHAFGRPMTEQELCEAWGEYKRPEILKYHLRTLLEAEVVAIVGGPELKYGLTGAVDPEIAPGFQGGADCSN